MVSNLSKISIGFIVILSASLGYAATLEEGTEIVLVDRENSTIQMGQDFSFENVTVYGEYVEFEENDIRNNITVYPVDDDQILNSTLDEYLLNEPRSVGPGETIFEMETEAEGDIDVTYEIDTKELETGVYEFIRDGETLDASEAEEEGTDTFEYTEDDWSTNNTVSVQYAGGIVDLEWTSKSDNEDYFAVYSNASGSFPESLSDEEVRASGGIESGENQTAQHSSADVEDGEINDGETVCYKVRAVNQYGYSSPVEGCIDIPE